MSVNKLKLKRSAVAGRYPTTSSLDLGELAINTYEGKVFLKKDDGVQTIVQLADISGSILSASYAHTASHSDRFTVTGPINVYGSQYISGSLVVGNDITARRLVVQTITSSVIYSSGSNVFGDATSDTQTFTGSVNISGSLNLVGNQTINSGYELTVDDINVNTIGDRSGDRLTLTANTSSVSGFLTVNNSISASGKIEAVSFTGSFSGSINNLQGTATHIPYFSSSQVLADSAMYQVGSASIAINQNGVTTAAPEALYVWQPNTDSFNVISGKGNSDNYLQLNIQNTNQGVSASSDVVATANNGDENNNYINMGINSENFNGPIGEGNDAYLYSTGNNLHIGNTKAGKHLGFFVGGDNADTDKKLQLNPTGHHQMTGSLDIDSQVTASAFVTRGATAAQFVKGDGSLDSTLYTSASVFNNTTSSLQAFSASMLAFTASTLVNSASFDTRIKYLSSSFEANTASFNAYSASMNAFSASILSTTASINSFSSSVLNFTASTLVNSASFDTRIKYISSSFEAATASLNAFSSSMLNFTASQKNSNGTFATTGSNIFKGNQTITGSLSVSGSTNIYGTTNVTGSVNVSGSTGTAITANVDTIVFTGSYAQSGSVNIQGTQSITGSLIVSNTITAERLIVQYISSSVIYSSGSNKFGDELSDVQQFTGSVDITGSLTVNGRNYITDSGSFDKRINYLSSSFEASSASLNSFTASINAFSASMLTTTASLNAFSSSVLNFTSSTLVNSASFDTRINYVSTSFEAATASLNLFSASMLSTTASLNAFSSSVLNFTASTLVNSASFDTRIQYISTSFEAATASLNLFSASMLSTTASVNAFSASVLSFTASTLVNSASFDTRINYISSSFEAATASLNLFSASVLSYTASNNAVIAKLYAETSSLLANTASMNLFSASMLSYTASTNATIADILIETASLQAFTQSMQNFTASTLINSASFDTRINYLSSSFEANSASLNLFTASFNAFSSSILNTTASINAFSASMLSFTASQKNSNGTFATTGSNIFIGNQVISGSTSMTGSLSLTGSQNIIGNLTVTDTITAERLIVQFITSSVAYVTGSTKFGDEVTDTHEFTGSVYISGSLVVNGRDYITDSGSFDKRINYISSSFEAATASLNAFSASILSYTASNNLFVADMLTETASLQAATASLNLFSASVLSFTASTLVNSASFDTRINYISSSFESTSASINAFSASILNYTASNNLFVADMLLETASLQAATASLNNFSASILSYTASNNAAIADILIETASLQAATASLNLFSASMLSFTASQKDLNGTFATTGSNVFRGNQTVTGSLFTSGSNTLVGLTTLTGSFLVSGSTTQTGNNTLIGNTLLSGSIIISGSVAAQADFSVGGTLRLDPAIDPGSNNLTASFLFTSASNTSTGYDLYYRQDGNLIKFKWIEGGLSTGILYGGGISYSGSTIFVKPGSGIINNMNASTGSEINPILTYVKWNSYTASVQNLTSSQNTYLYVDNAGTIHQQTTFFDQTQYEQAIPLGRVTHPNFVSITGYGSNVQTTYDSDTQQNDFIRAFGPIKVSGFSILPHTGSLGLGIGNGIAYNLGGFYNQDPNSPSHYESAGFATASIARAWRSGSGVYLDNNGGAFYNTVDPDYWDDGTGTLNTMNAGDWQIQRVFVNPVTGRTVVYYGQTGTYSNLLNALQYLATDPFTEGEFTAKSLVFAGYLVLKGQTNNLTDTVNNRIIDAGIFRNIAGGSSGGGTVAQSLENLSDVLITTPTNGQALVYNSGVWVNSNPLSSSYALTSSYSHTGTSASYASNADLLDGLDSTSFVSTGSFGAQTASFNAFSSSINSYTASAKIDSGSVSTRLVSLEAFSSSLDATFATDADLNALSASFVAHTASINAFSASINSYTASVNSTIAALYAETASISSYTASINAAIADILVETASLQAFSASILNYTASNNEAIAKLYAETASILNYTASNNTTIAAIYAETASIQLHTASINAFSASINAYTSSNNTAITSLYSATASLNSFSSSILNFTASQKNSNGTFATTGSNIFEGVQTINSNLVVTGSITAQTLVVQTITSSVDFVTGSTKFGTIISNTHQFTGSVSVSGSLAVNDSNVILTNQTASMSVATASYWSGSINNVLSASYAATASFALNVPETASFALTASYWSGSINNVLSASYALTASHATNVPETASFANNATSASYAITASHATNVPQTASFANNATSASYALTASFALNVPETASFALTASYWSGSIQNAVSSSFAELARSASFAATASYALFALNGGGGGGGGSVTTYQQVNQATTWSISHFLNTQTPVVQVYDSNFNTIIPTSIFNPGAFQTFIYFEVSQSGYAVLTTGGGLSVTGSNVILNQTVAATTWSFVHDLKSQYPVFTIFDDNDDVIIPLRIHAATTASAEIYFSTPRTGKAVASLAGFQSLVSSSISSSYATNADNATNAQSASYAGNYTLTSSFNTFSGSFVTYSGSINNRVVALEVFSSSLDATFATDADLNALSASFRNYTASINAFSASINNYTASNNAAIADILAETASLNAFSASILSFTSSYNTGSFTGSFVGTASFANNATSASFASTASYWSGSINNVLSASYAATASYADSFTVAGTLTAQTLVIQTITSSVIYSSGSNKFGNDLANTQQLTGSVTVTGSLAVNGSNVVLTNQTSSMSVASASFASTASFTPNAIVSAASDIPLNDTILFTLGNGTTSTVTVNNVGTASLANTASYWSGSINNALSASYAATASFVTLAQTASYWSGSIQNAVSAAFADLATSSSYASTASFALNGGGGGISAISIADEGILLGSASYFDFTGAGVSTIVNAGTASFTISGGGSGTQGLTTTFTQSSAAANWSFTHNLNTRTPVVQVYDSGYNQITPQSISSSNANEVVIGFGVATTGYAVISTGGALVVTGSNVILNQTASATTWSFNHGLNQQYPVFQVFNTDDEVIVPERIKAVDSASALIYFPTPVAGKAIASFAGLSGSIGGGSGAGFPFSGSAVITGSFLVSGSFVDFTQVSSFTGNLTGTASYATFALTASTAPGYTVQFSQTASAATWSFTHNMGTRNPIVQVYDTNYKQIIPNDIVGIDGSTAQIRFDYAQAGYAIMSNGGGLYITGSTSTLIQTSAATTWSFNHRLNTKYPAFEVYDSNDFVIIPANIRAIDTDNAELHFASAQTGRAIANFSGINGLQDNAVSASFALSSSNFVATSTIRLDQSLMDYAQVNSSIVGSNNMFTQATGSYTAAFFKYTAASGSNARAGEVTAVWNAGTTEFMDVSTNDIGNTNAVTASVAIVSGEAQLNFQTNTSGWRIKSTATFM